MNGRATQQDVVQIGANHDRWINEDWAGDANLALTSCLSELAETTGEEWKLLSDADQAVHIWLFTLFCPDRSQLVAVSREYYEAVHRQGGFHRVALWLRRLRGEHG
ncbi:hypothetical protein RM844_20975 [Streptomyces sp. DSM 44915]|uniref:Uncharacterized protein n=1 Tax=Streptomyces chisholmiae TaxID=3075540 RepID=A0ABU2JVH9_9ACTN|nr:hypothetical protein [Streptomyces sp. DSM 44915]MDT0268764.1 hypothetical protein [Streptomyces sp. DSM 44915]